MYGKANKNILDDAILVSWKSSYVHQSKLILGTFFHGKSL